MQMLENNTRELMSQAKFFEGYSRWNEDKNAYETWGESVERVMGMHRKYLADRLSADESGELESAFSFAEQMYKEQRVLGAQRALQFGGDQIIKNPMRLYNCVATYADRANFFGEFFHTLLCGAGAGFSVQKHHVAKIPQIQRRTKQAKIYVVEDSIEGWASALDVLMSSYFVGGGKYPEYEGRRVFFDTSKIRPKGAFISGGFKAPGPEPLRLALDRIEHLLEGIVLKNNVEVASMKPIHVYDISMHSADAVISGGVRRAATICLFSPDDEDMLAAKTGNWFMDNPQRGRSNNSAVIVRATATKAQFKNIMKYVKEFGEPGFVFVDSTEHVFNPCVEISFMPTLNGESGLQGCNLTEINGSKCSTKERFFDACKAASILGTIQATYTNFRFVSETTKKIFEREALIGCSITGWMNSPQVLLDEETLREGARIVKETNKRIAKLLGINAAARTTCVKPAGNASVLLQTASGVHGEHAPRYIRNVQMTKDSEVAQLIREKNPYMVEESVWSANKTDYVISFPVVAPKKSVFRNALLGVDFLEVVKKIQKNWVNEGTNVDLCVDPNLRHNVSNTVTVPRNKWDEIEDYIFENKDYFTGLSFIADSGDKDYNQAPNQEVKTPEAIVSEYGSAAMFASGLIVGSVTGFHDLWEACSVAQMSEDKGQQEDVDNRADWIRRFKKFAENYFGGDMKQTEYCLKDVYLLHKWQKIQQNYKGINFVDELTEKKYTDIDTTGSIACAAGGCEF